MMEWKTVLASIIWYCISLGVHFHWRMQFGMGFFLLPVATEAAASEVLPQDKHCRCDERRFLLYSSLEN